MQGEDANQPQGQPEDKYDYQAQESAPGSVFGGTKPSNNVSPAVNPEMFDSPTEALLTWEASEYLHHEKGSGWYLGLSGVLILIIALVYFFTRDILSSVVLLVLGVAVGIYAGRKPRSIRYAINSESLDVGAKVYKLDEFKSFSVNHEGGILGVTFMPTKRFMPTISIYVEPSDGDKIIEILSGVLPNEDHKSDLVDKFLNIIRF